MLAKNVKIMMEKSTETAESSSWKLINSTAVGSPQDQTRPFINRKQW